MIRLNDVLDCKRMMMYKNAMIEYTTDLNGVYVNPQDILYVMQVVHNGEFGYLQTIEDFVYLLEKHGCLSKSVLYYNHVTIADYLCENNINIDTVITMCDKAKCNKFKQFLVEAKEIILKYGIYIPEPKIKHYDRRKNNEKNLAETFDFSALTQGSYKLGMYEDNLYLEILNIVSNIVFNMDMESVRFNLNMMYDDYLSDYITDYEYDLVAHCCRIISYILNYSDIGVYGIEILTRCALEIALQDFDKNKYKSKERSRNVIENIFDQSLYNNDNNLEYNEERMTPKQQVSDEDLSDFKRYL
jgi:hypothetical protein